MRTLIFFVLFLLPLSASAFDWNGPAVQENQARVPNGVVDLRTGEMVWSMNSEELEAVKRYFPDVLDEAIAVFSCESGLNHEVNGRIVTSPTRDYGISQINAMHIEKAKSLGQDIFSLQGNLSFARYLYDQTGDWSAWVCKKVLS